MGFVATSSTKHFWIASSTRARRAEAGTPQSAARNATYSLTRISG